MDIRVWFFKLLLVGTAMLVPINAGFAASITSEKISTRYIELPPLALDGLDVSGVTAQLVQKDMKFLGRKLATTTQDTVCNALQQKLGLKGNYVNHYYAMSFSEPDPLMLLKSADGKLIYAKRVSPAMEPADRYGKGCMSSQASLDKALKEKGRSYSPQAFKNKMLSDTAKAVRKDLKTLLLPEFRKTKFKLYSAKGDQYQNLNRALQISLTTYKNMQDRPITKEDQNALNQSIDIWKKALEETDLNNKEARINKKLTTHLYHNIAMNYMAMADFQNAVKSLQRINQIWAGSRFTSTYFDPDKYSREALRRERAYKLSPNTARNTKNILNRIKEIKQQSGKIPLKLLESPVYTSVQKQVVAYEQSVKQNRQEQVQTAQRATTSSNPYAGQVAYTAMQGYTLFLMSRQTGFSKQICELKQLNYIHVAGGDITTLPAEIGQLKELKVLTLNGNKITRLPPEIGLLPKLEKLNLAKNQLTSLPEEIGQLKNLKKLNLKKNKLPKSEIEKLKRLLPKTKIKI